MCKVICIQNKQTAMFFTIAVTGLYWRWCRHWLTTFPSLSCSFPTSAVQVRSWWVFSCFASQIIRCSSDPSSCFKSENDWWDAPPPAPRPTPTTLTLIWSCFLQYGSTSGRKIRAGARSSGYGCDQILLRWCVAAKPPQLLTSSTSIH